MEQFFFTLLEMSARGTFVIAAVLLVRLCLRRAPRIYGYVLWLLPLARLLCPFSLPTGIGLVPTLPAAGQDYALQGIPVTPLGALDAAGQLVGDVFRGDAGMQQVPTAYENAAGRVYVTATAGDVLCLWAQYLYFAVLLALALYSLVRCVRLCRLLRGARPQPGHIYESDRIQGAFLLGLLRPRIYISAALDDTAREYILLHERAHRRRGDALWSALGYTAVCLHWFNPLVHLAWHLARRDMEMSCDEAVVARLGSAARAPYAQTLLQVSNPGSRRPFFAAFGEGDTAGRIRNLARWKKPALWVGIVCALVCALLTFLLLGDLPARRDSLTLQSADTDRASFTCDLGRTVGQMNLTVEQWIQGQCVSSAPVSFTAQGREMNIEYQLQRAENAPTGVQVHILTDQYSGSLVTFFPLPEGCDPRGWSFTAGKVGQRLHAEAGQERILCAMAFDMGGGVRTMDLQTMAEGDYLQAAACVVLVRARFFAEGPYPVQHTALQSDPAAVLPLSAVTALAQKGMDLTWRDFDGYDFFETGSGLYIRVYPIDDYYALWIGGGGTDTPPMYIHLKGSGDPAPGIDIRTGDVEAFLRANAAAQRDALVRSAALAHHAPTRADGDLHTAAYTLLAQEETGGTLTLYTLLRYASYSPHLSAEGTLQETGGSLVPTVFTFTRSGYQYALQDVWEPRDGSFYASDIRARFPAAAAEAALQGDTGDLQRACARQAWAMRAAGDVLEDTIAQCIDTLCATGHVSARQALLECPAIADRLVGYGQYTLRYCYTRLLQGDPDGTESRMLATLCQTIAAAWGETGLTTPQDGQQWFRAYRAQAEQLCASLDGDLFAKQHPAKALLLTVLDEMGA